MLCSTAESLTEPSSRLGFGLGVLGFGLGVLGSGLGVAHRAQLELEVAPRHYVAAPRARTQATAAAASAAAAARAAARPPPTAPGRLRRVTLELVVLG